MENDSRFRHELKYLINKRAMDCCLGRISEFAPSDRHAESGVYYVRSLYYDDMYASAYEDKESGVSSRSKYRIRTYNLDRGFIRLEKKIKEGAYVRKESAVLSENEYNDIRAGMTGFLLERKESVAKDFALSCRMDMLSPAVIVDYDRVPFVCEHGDVRITFDMNIRAVAADNDIFCRDVPAYNVLDQDLLIMEVKYTQFLPDIFRSILPDDSCRLAASKYVMCIDTLRRIMLK